MKMKRCPDCKAGNKESANFCYRCKIDICRVSPSEVCYIVVSPKGVVLANKIFPDKKVLIATLRNEIDELPRGWYLIKCFKDQVYPESCFEPLEQYNIYYSDYHPQFFQPGFKVTIHQPTV